MTITIKASDKTRRVDFTVNGVEYHTNDNGEGLWVGTDYMKQIAGTLDFNLKQKTNAGKRAAILRRFA
jgi:hypothetical protein